MNTVGWNILSDDNGFKSPTFMGVIFFINSSNTCWFISKSEDTIGVALEVTGLGLRSFKVKNIDLN